MLTAAQASIEPTAVAVGKFFASVLSRLSICRFNRADGRSRR